MIDKEVWCHVSAFEDYYVAGADVYTLAEQSRAYGQLDMDLADFVAVLA